MTTIRTWCVTTSLVLLVGCGGRSVHMPSPDVLPLPAPATTGFALTLGVTSELSEPYPITSGPGESYAYYAVAAQFRALLERQVAHLSDPGSPRRGTLSVRLTELTTRYRRLGTLSPPAPKSGLYYASLDPAQVVLAEFSEPQLVDRDDDIPEEIRKGATLVAEVTLEADGVAPLQRIVTAEHDTVVGRWEFDPRDAYSYTRVLDQALRAAVAEITALVQGHLMPGQNP